MTETNKIDFSGIEKVIITVKGQDVIIDSDVAIIYGVETKRVNEAVKENPDKFPVGYILKLTDEETHVLRSEITTLKKLGRGQHCSFLLKTVNILFINGYTWYILVNRRYKMQTTIVKWGNSQGIRLPKAFLQNINITENELVDVILEKEQIIIKKSNVKIHKTTKERLIDFYGPEYKRKHTPQKEIEWGIPVGKEQW